MRRVQYPDVAFFPEAAPFHRFRNIAQCPVAKAASARPRQEVDVDIGSEDRNVPAGKSVPEIESKQQRDRIRLCAGGAARTPNPQTLRVLLALDQLREDSGPQQVEV